MPKRTRRQGKKPDINELAHAIVDLATNEEEEQSPKDEESPPEDSGKDPHAVALGRKGGKIGGKARAANMTPEERSEAARKAAIARWKKKRKK